MLTNRQRGDTIIEVLLAMTVLAVLITITLTIMSRGLGSGYNSLDRTNSQAIMNGQASALRAIHAKYIGATTDAEKITWNAVVARVASPNTTTINNDGPNRADGCKSRVADAQRFYLNTSGLSVAVANTTGGSSANPVRTGTEPRAGDGIWIEGYRMTINPSDFSIDPNTYTFYIKSCNRPVYSDGTDVLRQSKTVLRLYAQ